MLIRIDKTSAEPLYLQIHSEIISGIARGELQPGNMLPSVRALASDLGVNLHTVNKAYTILCSEGYIVMDRRKGAIVAQTILHSEEFLSKISRRLTLSAAEARCREMGEEEFIRLCRACYRDTGKPIKNKEDMPCRI